MTLVVSSLFSYWHALDYLYSSLFMIINE